jgi:hypothetical protein
MNVRRKEWRARVREKRQAVLPACERCNTWAWCDRNGCAAVSEESARRLSGGTMTVETGGWIAIDDYSGLFVWGIGRTEDEAEKDAWTWLASERPKHGAALDYYPCTQAVLDYVRKQGGGDDLPLKLARHDGGVCVALADEEIETRCPYTADLFKQPEGPQSKP